MEAHFMIAGITFASLLLQNGESPQYVKEQLGHSSIKITVDIYGHLVPGDESAGSKSTSTYFHALL